MASWRLMNLICIGTVLVITASTATAVPVEVGTGQNSAGLYIEWSDGYLAEFLVKFDTSTVTGLGVFDIVEAATTLTTVRQDYGFGIFIDGIAYNGHTNTGYGGGEDWWHYWIKDSGESSWTSPAYGVADRVLSDGDMDGWIYGHAGAPVPEPATLALLGLGAMWLRRCRRRPAV